MNQTPRIALVTGASRGIGATIARRLSQARVGVVIAARGVGPCERLAAELRSEGGRAWPLALDVAAPRPQFASAMAELSALCEREGPIDCLVNNAGIAESSPLLPKPGSPADASDASFERHLNVNFHGPRRLVEALAPGMKERGYGRVVNVASSAALRGYAYVAAYCSSKFALLGYARAAAEELRGSGVTIHTVCPHYVDSPMLDASIANLVDKTGMDADAARRFFVDQNPGGRLVHPDDVAQAVQTLVARADTGSVLELDGASAVYVTPGS